MVLNWWRYIVIRIRSMWFELEFLRDIFGYVRVQSGIHIWIWWTISKRIKNFKSLHHLSKYFNLRKKHWKLCSQYLFSLKMMFCSGLPWFKVQQFNPNIPFPDISTFKILHKDYNQLMKSNDCGLSFVTFRRATCLLN